MTGDDKRIVKIGIAISAFAIAFYLILQNFNMAVNVASYVVGLFSAFIIGICIAFVLNILMTFFEKKIFSHVNEKKHPKFKKFKRPSALVLTIIVFLGIITALVSFIIPQFVDSAKQLAANINSYVASMQTFINETLNKFGISADINQTVTSFLTDLSDYVLSFAGDALPKIFEATKNITSGVVNTLLGFVLAIYMLATKETLLRNAKRVLYAFVPKRGADYTTHVYRLVKVRFCGFVTGQLTEAVIIGILCFLGMSIFGMEYALLISVIVGVTNMIPIIGPIIGAVPGAVIMLLVDPMKALWFVIFIIVLQQLESNLIYPKVVGDSIGLPAIWVIFAIVVGGALFGFAGILLGVPAFAVIYTLISEITDKRLKEKHLKIGVGNG